MTAILAGGLPRLAVLGWPKALVPIAIASLVFTGACSSGPSLSADSTCRDFMSASAEDQTSAVNMIATDLGAANATTPLGRPNVNYLCAQAPTRTLGWAVDETG